MHLQQPNTYAGKTEHTLQREFLLASELFIDDVFLIKKRERHISFITYTAIILCLSIAAVFILWSRRDTSGQSGQPVPAATTATKLPPPVDASVKKTASVSPQKTSRPSRPEQSSAGGSIVPRATPDKTIERTPIKKQSRRSTSPVSTEAPVRAPRKDTPSPPATARDHRSESPSPPKRMSRQAAEKEPAFSPGGDDNQFDRSAFYIPSDTRNAGNRRQSSGRFSSTSTGNTASSSSAVRNKTSIVAHIAQLHGGHLKQTLEHNGDYYKLKLVIPEKQLLHFKKDLAKMVEYASYSTIPEESNPTNTCLILETHFR